MTDQDQDHRQGVFAVMWDCHGLEAVEQVPDPALTTWALLRDKEPPKPPNLLHWQLRARYNTQRHYEIYVITAVAGIDVQDIRDMFEANPQQAADTIRRIGHCYYSDRVKPNQVVII